MILLPTYMNVLQTLTSLCMLQYLIFQTDTMLCMESRLKGGQREVDGGGKEGGS